MQQFFFQKEINIRPQREVAIWCIKITNRQNGIKMKILIFKINIVLKCILM